MARCLESAMLRPRQQIHLHERFLVALCLDSTYSRNKKLGCRLELPIQLSSGAPEEQAGEMLRTVQGTTARPNEAINKH